MQVIDGLTFPSTPEEVIQYIKYKHPSKKLSHTKASEILSIDICRMLSHSNKIKYYIDDYNPYNNTKNIHSIPYERFKKSFMYHLTYFRIYD